MITSISRNLERRSWNPATGYPYWQVSWFSSAHPAKSKNDYTNLGKILSSRLYVSSIYRATGPGIGDFFYIIHTAVEI